MGAVLFLRCLSSAGGSPSGRKGDKGIGKGVVTRDGSEDIAPGLGQQFLAALSLAFCACSWILRYGLFRRFV